MAESLEEKLTRWAEENAVRAIAREKALAQQPLAPHSMMIYTWGDDYGAIHHADGKVTSGFKSRDSWDQLVPPGFIWSEYRRPTLASAMGALRAVLAAGTSVIRNARLMGPAARPIFGLWETIYIISFRRVHLNKDGYAPRGSYFGHVTGTKIYQIDGPPGNLHFRASDRDDVVRQVKERWPNSIITRK